MNSDTMQNHNSVETLPEQLKRMYNLQNGSNDVSIRGSVFEDGDGAGNGSLHSREWQQSIDRRDLGGTSSNWIRLNVGGKIFQTTRDTLMKVPGSFLYRLCQDDKRLPSVKIFQTTRDTLMKVPGSFLYRLCQDDKRLPSVKGRWTVRTNVNCLSEALKGPLHVFSSYLMLSSQDETGAYLIDRDADYFSPVLNYLRHGRLIINPGLAEEGVLEEAEFYNLPQLVHLVNERIHEKERSATEAGRFKSVYRVIQCHEEELTTFISATSDGWKIVQVLPVQTKYQDYTVDRQQEYLCIVVRECLDNGSVSDSRDRATLLQQKARHN
ncbi:K+ channel tetramerization domain protein [Ancylostoma duodenale]|uniref:K+ channel tetramerization domain protein n=1 Tax=Ancylostoma duodenale TaxID=51022 RepID=A0A0C2CLQ6_9BILA|nr:K+ channel tetramerization domain protein [Ancylostoma duodenale]